jgi:hypothetical protein
MQQKNSYSRQSLNRKIKQLFLFAYLKKKEHNQIEDKIREIK